MKKVALNFILALIIKVGFGQDIQMFNTSNSKIIGNDLLSITIDNDGNKWIGTNGFGLVKFNDSIFSNLIYTDTIIKGRKMNPIFTDSKGDIWVSYSSPTNTIARLHKNNWTFFTDKILPNSGSVISITEDKNGKIYFGGADGVIIFDDGNWEKLELPSGDFTIRAIDVNFNGEIAIGHNSGLLIKRNGEWKKLTKENSELRLGTVRAVRYTSGNDLIIGYGGGFGDGGFSILKNDKWTHYNKGNSKIPDHMVRDIEIDENGTIWMATNNGVIKFSKNKITPIIFREGMYKNVVLDIALEGKTIWITTNFGLIKMK